jgi:hypothetical protein
LWEAIKKVTITILSGVPRYYTFWFRGIVQGHRVTTLIDGGATYNFIESTLIAKRQIPTEDFEGFEVVVEDGYNMTYTQWIRGLNVTLGNYTLTDEFYVVDLTTANMVLGVQWLYSLRNFKINYQEMWMEFMDTKHQRVILRGMLFGSPKVVSNKKMEAIFRHSDVACATKCLITT